MVISKNLIFFGMMLALVQAEKCTKHNDFCKKDKHGPKKYHHDIGGLIFWCILFCCCLGVAAFKVK